MDESQMMIPEFRLPDGFTQADHRPLNRDESVREEVMREEMMFREWYMTTIVERFPDELDRLRRVDEVGDEKEGGGPGAIRSSGEGFDVLISGLESGIELFKDFTGDDRDETKGEAVGLVGDGYDCKSLVVDTLKRLKK
ncbi:hypothetical protein BY996DRAFT_2931305 [Phakopsora pachyrhizi]|nr:hypothetical protein BY996DRAFT_2931305 [Phakopsora pachyrhizi]